MTLLSVPPLDDEPWPSLGGQVCDLIESAAVFGPGSLKGEPAVLDDEGRAIIWRAYEVFPKGHPRAGRRRWRRVAVSLPKGSSKTEKLGWIAFAELHPDGPVRFDGWDAYGNPVGRPVRDPYIPMVGVTEESTEELAYGVLYVQCTEGPDAHLFDAGLDRILRLDERGRRDGIAQALSAAPNARDGARTTWECFDEPLALDTAVPTPGGWRTVGDLQAGDFVYGRDGRAVRVLGGSPVHEGRPCYRVTFRGGDSVVTDGAHRWKAIDWSNIPKGEQVVTTEQMLARGVATPAGATRWRLPRPSGFDGVQADLPIDPYLLGVWLGDGATTAGYIHCHPDDYPEMSAGVEHTVATAQPGKSAMRWLPAGLRSKLRALGVFGDKHIPDAYLFASREQRVALLQGLMDTDGHAAPGGYCTFVQKGEAFARQVEFLVRSLGINASSRRYADARSRTGEMWKVHFTPTFCPFRLARKAARSSWGPRRESWWPAVESIEPVESVPVRCIAVDNDDHLFLVGRDLHLTHNTHRLVLPSYLKAHETMIGNLTKRPLDDPWHMEVTTAGELGQGSVGEKTHKEALAILEGSYRDPDLLYHHREADPAIRVVDDRGRVAPLEVRVRAVADARGGVGEYAPGQFEDIARQWDRPGADKSYLERVWLNRWVTSAQQAFDVPAWRAARARAAEEGLELVPGELVAVGFDGAKFRDSTAIVVCDVATGVLDLVAVWERPLDLPDEADWEVPSDEVVQALEGLFTTYQVWKVYADPPYWTDVIGDLAARHPDQVEEWWTNRFAAVGHANREFAEGLGDGSLIPGNGPLADILERHVAGAGRQSLNIWMPDGRQLYRLQKQHPDRKIDAGVAATLAWQARLEAVRKGAKKKTRRAPSRVR